MKIDYLVDTNEMMLKDFILLKGVSRSFARRVKLYGKMYINGIDAKNFYLVKKGDLVTLEYSEAMNDEIVTVEADLDILYEDNHIMVINKERGIASQPTRSHQSDNIISLVKAYFIKKGINSNIHLVNRLDFSTSGLLIVAKDGFTHNELSKIEIERKYLALVEGHLEKKEDLINLKIGRIEEGNIRRWVMDSGKEAITSYKVLKEFHSKEYSDASLVDIKLYTGRTHQIRVTFSYLGHPVIGDKLYGKGDDLMLHCYYLKFKDPYSDNYIEVEKKPNWQNYIEINDVFL